jgi:4-hydroxy-tetrahydrodipicolinate synthase
MTGKTSFRGSFTALVTPFKNGGVDEAAFRGLVEWQIAEGTNGLVPVGTTGESPTLSHDEHMRVVEWCVDQAKTRVPVIAGAGSNSTREAVEFSQHAEKVGADAVLIVTPYYNKPTQEGLYQHFKAINDAIGIPIIIYNIPGRSVIDMSVDTMTRLSRTPPPIWCASRSSAPPWVRTSTSSRARTPLRSASWPMAATAASR